MVLENHTQRNSIKEVHRPLLVKFDEIFSKFESRKEVKYYGHKRVLPNGMWFDLCCHLEKGPAVFRISRGAWLCRKDPAFKLLFTPLKVLGRMELWSIEMIDSLNLSYLIEYVSRAPSGIGAFD